MSGLPALLEIAGSLSNFGDGNAHRVTLWLQRARQYDAQALAEVSLLRPGDTTTFQFNVAAEDWSETELWVTWTPPPLRRRSEVTSRRYRAEDVFELTDPAESLIQKARESSEHTDTESGS
ncbi:hypothetical protein P5V43_05225 [Mycobacteroides abscessus subsp. bolletii]|uniref:hypothetical protein n=1 Tax=Mycobacteroides abscessus TaxID=36809 RepID=UPI00266C2384|nr:hypothetical protein [Mycobacteroides abscessus]MDO3126502.1 hypothetical protein [Mycobacteroides abscessus subsp. bolletii]